MFTFRRSLRLLFGLGGFLLGLFLAVSVYLAKMMIAPTRQTEWTNPEDFGLEFENVQFPAQDGLRVSGWFIPAIENQKTKKPTVVIVHSWQWNRAGYAPEGLFANLSGSTKIDLLRLAKIFHEEGYHVLTFDLRNHGQSATAYPITFGQSEAKDLLGALNFLEIREDVDRDHIGIMGFSMGANAALFALPQTNLMKAIVAIQPMTPALFSRRLTNDILGMFGPPIAFSVEIIYRLFGGPRIAGIIPAFAASGAERTPVLFVQGVGDSWGSLDDVSNMAEAIPTAQELLFVNSSHRYEGYQYIIDNPGPACAFFKQHLGDQRLK